MKKLFACVLAVMLAVSAAAFAEEAKPEIRVASLKGPTTMGLVKLMQDDEAGRSAKRLHLYHGRHGGRHRSPLHRARGTGHRAWCRATWLPFCINNTEGAVQVAGHQHAGRDLRDRNRAIPSSPWPIWRGKTLYLHGPGHHAGIRAGLHPGKATAWIRTAT